MTYDLWDRRSFVASATAASLSLRGFEVRRPPRVVVDGLDTSVINDGFLGLVRQGGVHCVHKTLYREDSFREFRNFVAERRDKVALATTVQEIRAAQESGRVAFVLGVQAAGGPYGNGLDLAMENVPLGSLNAIRPALLGYHELGLRIQGLCYNGYNVFGSGCMDHTVPLTRAGRRLIEEIHRSSIVLDVGGHSGERTSFDALGVSSGVPVIVSHTNFARLNPNMRCISDRLAETVARTGGVIGLTAISDFVARNPATAKRDGPTSPRAGLSVLLDHFDHGKRLLGAEHLGVGPDFLWGQEPVAVDPSDAATFTPDALSAGPVRTVSGFEDISQLPALIEGLEQRGWTHPELDQVLGASWLRAWGKVWGN